MFRSPLQTLTTLRMQLQGSAHTTADSTRPLCTQLQSLYLPTNTLDSDLQTQREYCLHKPITFKIFSKKLPSNHRSFLYLYISMVRTPWASQLTFYFLTLFLDGQPFHLTHYNSCSVHLTELLPYFYPKLWPLSPKTITRALRYPTQI